MGMKSKQAVVCPNCGALSRPSWEFCARCNASLEGAVPAEGDSRAVADEAAPTGSSLPSGAVALTAIVLLVAVGIVAWRYATQAPPPGRPDPSLFTFTTRPVELPSPLPVTGPGAADFEAGRRLVASGDVAGALGRLAAAAAANPNNAEYQSAYGRALWRAGNREAAVAAFGEAARLDPRQQLQYARTLDVTGRSADAVRQYEEFLARSPGATAAREDLGRLLFRTGDYKKAASLLQEAVKARPDDAVLRQELAYSLDQAGNRSQAVDLYRQVLKQAPQAVITRGLLAENLAEEGKSEEALAVLREGLKATPSAPLLQRQMGSVLERASRPAEAAAAYRSYVSLAPNAPDAAEMAARATRLEAGKKP
jgi:Flp pilus assembly protein TadD